jgi:hypothetical protein
VRRTALCSQVQRGLERGAEELRLRNTLPIPFCAQSARRPPPARPRLVRISRDVKHHRDRFRHRHVAVLEKRHSAEEVERAVAPIRREADGHEGVGQPHLFAQPCHPQTPRAESRYILDVRRLVDRPARRRGWPQRGSRLRTRQGRVLLRLWRSRRPRPRVPQQDRSLPISMHGAWAGRAPDER